MTFEEQIWLALTPLLALISLGLIALGWRKRSHLLSRFAAARLLDRLTEKASVQRKMLKSALIVAAVIALGIALARPQYGVEWSERKARGLDIVFALDSSKSMLATDMRPTRLERAKLAILDLIERLESDRIGLVAFAGQAFLQTPPTLDYSAFRESLDATDPSILSRGGSDLGRAIEEAAKAFPTENNVKVVVLLTDGEDLGGQAIEAARKAADNGIQIFAIGIGTPEGEYLRVQNAQGIEEFVRDDNGQPVRSQLDESTLQQIAQLTGGTYSRLSSNSLDALYDSVLATLPRTERESELQEVRIERFQWLLGVALLFLVLEILIRNRRPNSAHASALILSLFLLTPHPSEANESYNQAHAALAAGEFTKANELYSEAIQQTEDLQLQRDALYNMGHATYQIGRTAYDGGDPQAALKEVKAAEQLFQSALEIDPNDRTVKEDLERTRKVREAIEEVIQQQEQQQEQEQEQQQQEQENQKSGEQQNENQQSGEQQENESSSSENQESQSDPSQEADQTGADENEESGENQDQNSQSTQQDAQNQQGDSDQEASPQQSEESRSADEQSGDEQSGQSQPEDQGSGNETQSQSPDTTQETGEERESQQPVPEVSDGEQDGVERGSDSAQADGTIQVEGMTLQEAKDLLDSLQAKEEILPFTKPAPGNARPLKDW